MRPSWDEYFLAIAATVSTRADCTRRKVGCVLVDARHRVVSVGYNGTSPGKDGCLAGACPRGRLSYEQQPAFVGYENCIAVHAEVNALIVASGKADVAYITCAPCPSCRSALDSAGITRVVWPDGDLTL